MKRSRVRRDRKTRSDKKDYYLFITWTRIIWGPESTSQIGFHELQVSHRDWFERGRSSYRFLFE